MCKCCLNSWAVTLLLVCFSMQSLADDQQHVQWSGFLAQGFIKSSDNNFFGESTEGTFDLTEVGVSASYRATDDVLLSGQVLSRHAGEMFDATPSVDFLLIDYSLFKSESNHTGVRLGRIKNPLGLYNDTRDVAFTRPGILLPEVIYFDKVRNLMLSSDGVMFYHNIFTDNGNYALTLGVGESRIDTNVEISYLRGDKLGKLEADGMALIVRAVYATIDDALKLGLSGAFPNLQYNPVSGDRLQDGTTRIKYWIASAQYNLEKWSISAEYMHQPISWEGYGPYFPDKKATAVGYFLQSSFRVQPTLEFLFRYEKGYPDKDDKSGVKASESLAAVGIDIPAYDGYSKIITTGVRWDISPSLMVRAEYQKHEGTFILSFLENEIPSDLVKDWHMLSVLVSYRF